MTKRLVKIAMELNVGTTTIVDYLTDKGFEIENKPTAKVTDEMYAELLKEFQKSIAIKEKADSLVIGTRTTPAAKKEAPQKAEQAVFSEAEPLKKSEQPVAKTTTTPKTEEVEEKAKPAAPRLKVLGKIDLESRLKPKKETEPFKEKEAAPAEQEKAVPKEEAKTTAPEKKAAEKITPAEEPARPEAEEKKEMPAEKEEKKEVRPEEKEEKKEKKEQPAEVKKTDKEEKKEKTETPAVTETQPEAVEEKAEKKEEGAEKDALIRAEAPELRGLKILGKIDADKLDRPKKKKKKSKGAADSDDKAKSPKPGDDGDTQKKRRRKRKKVSAPVGGRGDKQSRRRGDRQGGRQEETKEVSQKEIEEKIKATMARLSGGGKKKRQKLRRETRERLKERQEQREMEMHSDKLQVTEFISVQELANLMNVGVTEVITTCLNLGVIVSINQRLDAEIIELVAEEFGHEVEFISVEEQTEEEFEIEDDPEDLEPRAPIVTVMGHVDHGKTSLLDYIRKANVASGEAGGITQHIGAYEVEVGEELKKITFLDTPGHEAFTAMRARGAKVTDIAIIIIAADDNIMPQTKEAISHAQAAGVPMVFAINKIDKPGANPDKIKQELASMNLLIEEWGGKYQSQDISAKTGVGIDQLLEKILLEAELLELKANIDHDAWGTVIEASLDRGRGYVTKTLVQNGTLEIGDVVVAGEYSGKVKAMFNERGKRVKSAGPSTPVLILGLDGAPQAGERFKVMESEQEARSLASKRGQIAREQATRATKRISLDEIGRRLALGNFKELNLIVKGDVDGSIEALSDSLIKLSQETVQVNVIHKAVGQIIESDVLLASASDAIIIGFQVRPSGSARKLAEKEGVEIKTYSIIYEAIEEVKMAIEGMLEPTKEEKIVAEVEVREVYKISKVGTVAGCFVQDGKMTRNTHIRLIRDGIVVFPTKEGQHGEIASLKRFKDDAKEVRAGLECGISIKNFNDIKVGDIIEGYEIIEIKQKLA